MAIANPIMEAKVEIRGCSIGIIIPQPYAKVYDIERGDKLEIDLSTVKVIKNNVKKE